MHVVRTHWSRHGATIDGALVLLQGVRAFVVETHGLVFDARFLAPASGAEPMAHLFAVLEGWVEIEGHARVSAPAMLLADGGEFETRREGALGFRFGGAPRKTIELSFEPRHLAVPCGLSHGVRPLPEALLGPSERFVEATQRSAEASEAFAALLETLASEGLCALPVAPLDAGTRSLQRVLDALSSLYGGQRTGAHGDLVAELARVSLRQLSRDMRDFTQSAPIPGATMRELFRVMRLRRAALLLSAAELSVEDVAREVGYGSSDAMGRAFRDARLPSPSEMRRSLVESE